MKKIKLTQDEVALVDDCDFEELNKYKWSTVRDKNTCYAYRAIKNNNPPPRQKHISMHRTILNSPVGTKTDHKDGNGLNNQRENIRVCSHSQNMHNSSVHYNNKLGHKGVYFYKQTNKYKAQISFENHRIALGYFNTLKEAVIAYNNAAVKFYGEFARLNIIPGDK